jgi:hypothetical protein
MMQYTQKATTPISAMLAIGRTIIDVESRPEVCPGTSGPARK